MLCNLFHNLTKINKNQIIINVHTSLQLNSHNKILDYIHSQQEYKSFHFQHDLYGRCNLVHILDNLLQIVHIHCKLMNKLLIR
jgi:hypothetical protein